MASEIHTVVSAEEFHSNAAEFAPARASLRIASAAKPRKSKNIMKQAAKFAALAGAGGAVAVVTGTTKVSCTVNAAQTGASALVQVSKDAKDQTNPDVTYTLYDTGDTVIVRGTLKKGVKKQTLHFENLVPGSLYTLRFTIPHEGATRVVGRALFQTRKNSFSAALSRPTANAPPQSVGTIDANT